MIYTPLKDKYILQPPLAFSGSGIRGKGPLRSGNGPLRRGEIWGAPTMVENGPSKKAH